MKAYLFDIGSGIYEGEDFIEPHQVNEEEGITSIAPPVQHSGQVPVYNRTLGNWQLVPVDVMKATVKHHE